MQSIDRRAFPARASACQRCRVGAATRPTRGEDLAAGFLVGVAAAKAAPVPA